VRRVHDEATAKRIIDYMATLDINLHLSKTASTTQASTVKEARFPGKASMVMFENLEKVFLMTADPLGSADDMRAYDSFKQAHLGFARALTVLWRRDAPVTRLGSLRMLAALSTIYGRDLHQVDITQAYIIADFDKEMYVKDPTQLSDQVRRRPCANPGLSSDPEPAS